MNDDYYLALAAYRRYLLNDEKVKRKVVRELNAAEHAHAALVEALIRLKHKRKFDKPEAVLAAFIKAGELGIAFGYFRAGRCCARGYGVKKSRKTAARRYRQAAGQGSISAMVALGTMYIRGDGVAANPSKAESLYWKAAMARVPYSNRAASARDGSVLDRVFLKESEAQTKAMEQLGALYRDGAEGIAPDLGFAHKWFRDAARNGSAAAKSSLRKLPPLPPAPPAPSELPPIRKGLPIVDTGIRVNDMDSTAAFLKGQAYRGDTQPDYKLAARHFLIAAQLGHRDARSALQEVEATVGERTYRLFFAGWNVTFPP